MMVGNNGFIERILRAQVYAGETDPSGKAPRLSKAIGNDLFLKREDMQPVFSFKLRGAFNKIAQLSPEARAAGWLRHRRVIMLRARLCGGLTDVMQRYLCLNPRLLLRLKRCELGGPRLRTNFDDQGGSSCFAEEHDLVFVHPFDDMDVIAGQGTVGVELVRQLDGNVDAVFVCVGGGLIAGISSYVKTLLPDTLVIGVEPADSPTLQQALLAGEPVDLEHVGLFADGASVKRIGDNTFALAKEYVDDVCLVDTDETCAAIKDVSRKHERF